ncbi:hypothetical protein [Bdellovibrio sp. NC01]|uniref:hypothetical protein n=1 Tax=Bdellovibrio sp. NC01 TaxID=2220073 RepID=UPI0011575ABE|nr:hypothetical protein [Bdellovibrio sp. NC01]QDK37957.1 hypothetical protein DOE51_10340 [Bdellovibrio sp. NC01]
MTSFEFYGSIAMILFLMVGFFRAIKNFKFVYYRKGAYASEGARKLYLIYAGIGIAGIPFVIAVLTYLLITRGLR